MDEPIKPKTQEGVFDLKHGYPKGCLLPTLTAVIGIAIASYSVRHFCIEGTMLDNRKPTMDRDIYYDARRDYYDGNFDTAISQIGKILDKQPNHAEANQLMARIALARGNREQALVYLRRALDSSLDREEISQWISKLEVPHPK